MSLGLGYAFIPSPMLSQPCSGSCFRANPNPNQDAQSLAQLEQTQAAMLRALWQLLRPGGALLYMTCSLLRAENDTLNSLSARPSPGPVENTTLRSPRSDAATTPDAACSNSETLL